MPLSKLKYLTTPLAQSDKSKGFAALGYSAEKLDQLGDVLASTRKLINPKLVSKISQFGEKFQVSMNIVGIVGSKGTVNVVWRKDNGTKVYKLVAAWAQPH